jgi:hypothetical protein
MTSALTFQVEGHRVIELEPPCGGSDDNGQGTPSTEPLRPGIPQMSTLVLVGRSVDLSDGQAGLIGTRVKPGVVAQP